MHIVIPIYNQWPKVSLCLDALVRSKLFKNIKVTLVNDASTRPVPLYIQKTIERNNLEYIENKKNLGFAASCNSGFTKGKEKESTLFLNSDVIIPCDLLVSISKFFNRYSKLGILGTKLIYPDKRIQFDGGVFVGALNSKDFPRPVHLNYKQRSGLSKGVYYSSFVTGALLAIRNNVFEKTGGFCEKFVNGFEDIDLCLSCWESGYEVMYHNELSAIHYEGASRKDPLKNEHYNWQLLQSKWSNKVSADIYTRDAKIFSFSSKSKIKPVKSSNTKLQSLKPKAIPNDIITSLLIDLGSRKKSLADKERFYKEAIIVLNKIKNKSSLENYRLAGLYRDLGLNKKSKIKYKQLLKINCSKEMKAGAAFHLAHLYSEDVISYKKYLRKSLAYNPNHQKAKLDLLLTTKNSF